MRVRHVDEVGLWRWKEGGFTGAQVLLVLVVALHRRKILRNARRSHNDPDQRALVKKRNAIVNRTFDHGIYLRDKNNVEMFVHVNRLRHPWNDYISGQELTVTVLLEAGDVPGHPQALASELDLRSVKTLKLGDEVNGRVQTFIPPNIVMFDIGVDQAALAWQEELEHERGHGAQSLKPGDTVYGMRVATFRRKHVFLGPPGCELRDLESLRFGQRLNAFVREISVKNGAVFYDVKAQDLGAHQGGHARACFF